MKSTCLRALSLSALALAALPANAQYGFNSVASTATLTNATAFASTNRTYINSSGDIAFTATVSGNRTLYKNIAGTNTVVAAQNAATAYGSTYGSNIDGLNVILSNAGQVTFRGDATAATPVTAADNTAIVRDTTIVSREGTTPTEGSTPATLGNYDANNAGTTVYAGSLNTGGNGLFSVSSTGVSSRLVAGGASAPGITGGTFNAFLFPSLDSTGNISFQSTISGAGTITAGLFNLSAGGITTKIAAVTENDVTGNAYSAFAGIVRGDSGVIAANAVANGNRGIYLGTGNALTSLVARQGQTILGATYGGAFSLGNINASGTGVFRATGLTGGTFTDAIFTFNSTGQVSKVLTNADPLFGSNATALGIPTINNAGQVAFTYTLASGTQGALVGAVVPEAGTVALLALGAATLGAVVIRRK